ncbi:MAG: hypothetical protein IKR04_04555 [Clostridia bacterium]|nr:hypothetical protein [Clostridia bacterium]
MAYYSDGYERFLTGFHAIIGARDSGKTTILQNVFNLAYDQGYTIVIIDSCTDHPNKSLLVRTHQAFEDSVHITSPEKSRILQSYFIPFKTDFYPCEMIAMNLNKRIFLFDVSKYLEEGYDTEDLKKREEIRMYYKRLARQILYAVQKMLMTKKVIILMDEIELIPSMFNVLVDLKDSSTSIVMTLHSSVSLKFFGTLFKEVRLE